MVEYDGAVDSLLRQVQNVRCFGPRQACSAEQLNVTGEYLLRRWDYCLVTKERVKPPLNAGGGFDAELLRDNAINE